MTTLIVSLEAFNSASLKSDGDMYCLDLQVHFVFFSFPRTLAASVVQM